MVAARSCSEHGPAIGCILRGRPGGLGRALPAPAAAAAGGGAAAFGLGGFFRFFFPDD
jgi:hypothetical protein